MPPTSTVESGENLIGRASFGRMRTRDEERSHRHLQPMAGTDFCEPSQIGIHRRYLACQVGEHLRSAKPRRHGDHFGAARAEAEPMHSAGGEMNECARRYRRRLGTDAKIDLSVDDKEGLVPRMAVRRWTTALGAPLVEDLITFRRFARCEYGDVFADDVERRRVILWRHHERFYSHLGLPFPTSVSRAA